MTQTAHAEGRLLTEAANGIGTITFNNPDKHNAMSGDMWLAVEATLAAWTDDPDVRVVVLQGAGATFFRDGEPERRPLDVADADIAALVGVDALAGAPWQAGYGTSYVLVPLADRDAVARAETRLDHWRKLAPRLWGHALYVFAVTGPGTVHARMFAPSLGVAEDPATGSAAAALIGSLPGPADGTAHLAITQGVEMGRPSTILCSATRQAGVVQQISIGGGAIVVGEGRFSRLP